jgi:hypothetical protein
MVRLVQSKSSFQSLFGTPSIQAITAIGSGAETFCTKSHSPSSVSSISESTISLPICHVGVHAAAPPPEAVADQIPVGGVLGIVHLDQRRRKEVRDLGLVGEHQARAVQEQVRALADRHDVGVLGNRPERHALGLVEPVHGIFAAQALPDGMGIAVGGVVLRMDQVEVLERIDCAARHGASPARSGAHLSAGAGRRR